MDKTLAFAQEDVMHDHHVDSIRFRGARNARRGAGRLCFAATLLLAAAASTADEPRPEGGSHEKGGGATGVYVDASVESDGVGLDKIVFKVHKPILGRGGKATIHVKTASLQGTPRTVDLTAELTRAQPWATIELRIPPLAQGQTFEYSWEGLGAKGGPLTIDYAPSHRLQYRNSQGIWEVKLHTSEGGDPTLNGAILDASNAGALFTERLRAGASRSYEFTVHSGHVTLALKDLYQIRIASGTNVVIKETCDPSRAPLGYSYRFDVRKGFLSVDRETYAQPWNGWWATQHLGRKPAELWAIWTMQRVHQLNGYAVKDGVQDGMGFVLEALSEVRGLGLAKYNGAPWQSSAMEYVGGSLWNHANLNTVLGALPDFARRHAEATRARAQFDLGAAATRLTPEQGMAAFNLFRLLRDGNWSDMGPSSSTLVLSFEWAYLLAWIHSDLFIENRPNDSVLTEGEAPRDFFFENGLFEKVRGTIFTHGFTIENKGTTWTASVTGTCAMASDNRIRLYDESTGETRYVGTLSSDMTVRRLRWSADGQRLAFTAYTKDANGLPVRGEVWTVKWDGSDLRRIAAGEEAAEDVPGRPHASRKRDFFAAIDFSPDGIQVSAQRFRHFQDRRTDFDWEDVDLVLIPVAGGEPAEVAGARWTRYTMYGGHFGAESYALPFWSTTAWSSRDELLFGREYIQYVTGLSFRPQEGIADQTRFTFQAIHWDAYGKEPRSATYVLGGTEVPMTFKRWLHEGVEGWEDHAHGAVYEGETTLPSGVSMAGSKFVFVSYKGDETSYDTSGFSPKLHALSNVRATLTNQAQAEAWGTYTYEVSVDWTAAAGTSGKPWLVVDAPSIGQAAWQMDRSTGTTYKRRFTLPLTWRAGESTTTDVKYRVLLPAACEGLGPYTITVTRTWPDRPWKSSTGEVSTNRSVSGSGSYTDGEGTTTTNHSVEGGISATRGRPTDTFCYRAKYTNSSGRRPSTARIVIDSQEFAMTEVAGLATANSWTYEYTTTLAAQAALHRWGLVFAQGANTIRTSLTTGPWVAEASLSNGSATASSSNAQEVVFRVTARQTAGQGKVWLFLRGVDGEPRYLAPMSLVSGSLATGGTYEKTINPWYTAYQYEDATGRGGKGSNSVQRLGEVRMPYQFILLDGFDGTGTKLSDVLARTGARTAEATLTYFWRNGTGSGSTSCQSNWREQIVLSTPGRAALREDLFPDGSPHGEMAWEPGTRRFAAVKRAANCGLSVFEMQDDGTPRSEWDISGTFAGLSGWAPEGNAVFVARRAEGAWEHGSLVLTPGGFAPAERNVSSLTLGGEPVGSWREASPPTRAGAACTHGRMGFQREDDGQGVTVRAGQKSGWDLQRGENGPSAPEAVSSPYVTASRADAPASSGSLYEGRASYSSSSVRLADEVPADGEADVATGTPTFSFSTSTEVTEESVRGTTFEITGERAESELSGPLRALESEGKVRLSTSGSSVQVTPVQPLRAGTYHVELRPAGDVAAPERAGGGWFRVVPPLDAAGGVFSLEKNGIQAVVPAGALSSEAAFDVSIPESLSGAPPEGCTPLRAPVAVSWTSGARLASPAALVFRLESTETTDGMEPVVGTWSGGAWTLVESTLSDGGTLIATPISAPGVYGLFARARTTPDLTLAIEVDATSVAPGGEIGCGIHAVDRAGAAAANVVVRCTLPPGVEYVDGSTSGATYDASMRRLEWRLGTLPASLSRRMGVDVRVAGDAAEGTSFAIEAVLLADGVADPIRATSAAIRVRRTGTIVVATNVEAATYALRGSGAAEGVEYAGAGTAWQTDLAVAGSYTIEFASVDGYLLPTSTGSSQAVVAAQATTFMGAYRADSDRDGLADEWEREHFGDLSADPSGDDDGDGASNMEEFLAGTDPRDPTSKPSVWGIEPGTICGLKPDGMLGADGFAGPAALLDQATYTAWEAQVLDEGGFGWDRTLERSVCFSWSAIEPVRGQYDFLATDALVAACQARGLRILAVLEPWTAWDQDWRPGKRATFPVNWEAYLAYVRAVVERYDGDGAGDMPGLRRGYGVRHWEVHNEPELAHNTWEGYLELLRRTYPVIKQADAGATVLNGGVSPVWGVDPQTGKARQNPQVAAFWNSVLDAGGAQYIDVFNVHDLVGNFYDTPVSSYLAPWKERFQRAGRPMRIWVTESGTYSGSVAAEDTPERIAWPERTEAEQAWRGVRRLIESYAAGADTVFWAHVDHYAANQPAFAKAGDLFTDADHAKPAYFALKRAMNLLQGATELYVDASSASAGAFRLVGPYATVYVLWNENGDVRRLTGLTATQALVLASVPTVSAGGEPTFQDRIDAIVGGELTVRLSSEPTYVVVGTAPPAAFDGDGSARFGCWRTSATFALMDELGLRWVREPFDVADVVTRPIDFTRMDERILAAQRAGRSIHAILNPRRSDGRWPTAAAFAAYLGEVVERFDADGVGDAAGLLAPVGVWEICNEIMIFSENDPRTQDPNYQWAGFTDAMYAEYLQRCADAVRAAYPSGRLACGAIVSIPPNDLDDTLGRAVALGAGPSIGAISFHDYRDGLDAARLPAYLARLGLDDRPVYGTETDMQVDYVTGGISQEEGARRLVRSYAWALAWGMDALVYSELTETEQQPEFVAWATLVDLDGNRRPSYHALEALVERVDRFTRVEAVDAGPGVCAFRFTVGSRSIWAIWSVVERTASIPFAAARANVTSSVPRDAEGTFDTTTLAPANGRLSLVVGPTMIYVEEAAEDATPPAAVGNLSAATGQSGGAPLGAWACAASSETSPAAQLMDGSAATGWVSLPVPTVREDSVTLDLGQYREVASIDLLPLTGQEASFPRGFTLEGSRDGAAWIALRGVTGETAAAGEVKSYTFDAVVVRHVRVRCTDVAAGAGGYFRYAIGEVVVYASRVEDPTRARVAWSAPPDGGSTGRASSYDLRYASGALDETTWASATAVTGLPAPGAAGETQSVDVSGLTPGATYAFGLKSADAAGNVSSLSNVAVLTLPTGQDTLAPEAIRDLRAEARTLSGSGSRAQASSASASTSYSANYDASKAADGDATTAWSSAESGVFRPESLTLDLGQARLIDRVRALPRQGMSELFPQAFRVEGSADGTLWATLAERSGVTASDGQWVETTFATAVARYVRLLATDGGAYSANGKYYVQVAEMEAYEASSQSATVVVLGWTSPLDPGSRSHRAARYRLLYSQSEITAANASQAGVWAESDTPTPAAPGTGQTALLRGLAGGRTWYFAVVSIDEAGNASTVSNSTSVWVPAAPAGVVIGLGTRGAGKLEVWERRASTYAGGTWLQSPWADYNQAVGETHAACGDVDGDGRDEVVVGLGKYPARGGWLVVFDDATAGHALLAWKQVPWSAYNAANGETWPACGDVDGDGVDEVVVGLGTYSTTGGYAYVFDDIVRGTGRGWIRLSWATYTSTGKGVRPACGNLDADAADEIVLGLDSGGQGLLARLDDASRGFVSLGWTVVPWAAYNSANGQTWPALGDVNGDGKEDLVSGLGSYSTTGGKFVVFPNQGTTLGTGQWGALPWAAYNATGKGVRPAVANLDDDRAAEVVLGLEEHTAGGGYCALLDDASGRYAAIQWVRVGWTEYVTAGGATRPAAGRLR